MSGCCLLPRAVCDTVQLRGALSVVSHLAPVAPSLHLEVAWFAAAAPTSSGSSGSSVPRIPQSQLLSPAICPSDAGESRRAGACQAPRNPAHQLYNLDINEGRELKVAVGVLCGFSALHLTVFQKCADGGWRARMRHYPLKNWS